MDDRGGDGRVRRGLVSLGPLATAVRDGGGLLADVVADPPYPRAEWGTRVADQYALIVEAIREGYELHYGNPRVVAPDDPDLALLAGDRLYALGLARLAELGDLEAVVVLADLIADSARAHAERSPDRARAAWHEATANLTEPNR
jgi:hypothetical protein